MRARIAVATSLSLDTAADRETETLGEHLGACLLPGDVVGLSGDLGAGKTCLVRGVARGVAVPEGVGVSSPTFTLINEYPGRLLLVHADLYRLTAISDLVEIGLLDALGQDNACIVEWFDRFAELAAEPHLQVQIALVGETARRLTLAAHGEKPGQLLSRLRSRLRL